jgi:hypothetical protein
MTGWLLHSRSSLCSAQTIDSRTSLLQNPTGSLLAFQCIARFRNLFLLWHLCLRFLNGTSYTALRLLNPWRKQHFTKPRHRTTFNNSHHFWSVSKMAGFSKTNFSLFFVPGKQSRIQLIETLHTFQLYEFCSLNNKTTVPKRKTITQMVKFMT